MGSKTRFQKPLECVLTESEKVSYSQELADKCVKRAGLIEEKKAVSAGFNLQIKEIDEARKNKVSVLLKSEVVEELTEDIE